MSEVLSLQEQLEEKAFIIGELNLSEQLLLCTKSKLIKLDDVLEVVKQHRENIESQIESQGNRIKELHSYVKCIKKNSVCKEELQKLTQDFPIEELEQYRLKDKDEKETIVRNRPQLKVLEWFERLVALQKESE